MSTQFFTASVAEELLNTELTEESKDRARNLLKEFGLYEYRDAHPSALSGGQKQRLAIACAIFSGRRILILDEPTSGLDGQNMRLVAKRLKSEARNGRTILVITHDRELIESCCDNVVEVENGHHETAKGRYGISTLRESLSVPAGSPTAMVVPFSELSSTQTEPPWSSAISHTSESPSPAPPYSRLRDLSTRKNGWKILR